MEYISNFLTIKGIGILFIFISSIFYSCTDEIQYEHLSNDIITYKPILSSTWDYARSRSSSESNAQMSVLNAECQTFDMPLYVHALSFAREEKNTQIAYEPISRGTMTSSNDGLFDVSIYKEMGVIAYAYGKNEEFPVSGNPNFINNDKVTMVGTTISSDRYWPLEDCNISFFAYAPYDKVKIDSPISGNPSFTYTTPSGEIEDIISQPDLLVSKRKDVSSSSRQRVQLEFCHALTAVTIIASPDFAKGEHSSCVIKSVALRNVYDTGTLQWGIIGNGKDIDSHNLPGSSLFSWTQQTHKTSFEFSYTTSENNGIALGNHNKEISLNDDNDGLTLMMIPQTLPEDAILEIEFVDDLTGNTHFSKIPLDGQQWIAGHQMTYRLSTNDQFIVPILEVSLNVNNGEYNTDKPIVDQISVNDYKYLEVFDYLGNWKCKDEYGVESEQHKRSFQIDSYAQIATSGSSEPTKIPLGWNAEVKYVVDGVPIDENNIEIKDRWLNGLDRCGKGQLSYPNSFDISPQKSKESSNNSNKNISKRSFFAGSKTSPYDLSTNGGSESRTTANCYIVNNPGYYSFPLVYGNAIKNNDDETTAAYQSTADDLTLEGIGLRNLLNYDDAPISSSYIYKDRLKNNDIIEIKSACILWTDVPNLIESNSVELDSKKENLIFKIPDGFMTSGNALLGILDNNNKIIWSWHIWYTDYNPYGVGESADVITISEKKFTSDNNGRSTNYIFMRHPIGWCDGKSIIYAQRDADIIISQNNEKEEIQNLKIRVRSSEHNDITPGNNTLYQFGRKDPMPGVVFDESGKSKQKPTYGFQLEIVPSISMSIGEAISKPTTFSYQSGSATWVKDNQMPYNLWAINAGKSNPQVLTSTLKTIYDPSPRGFKIPDNRVFYKSISTYYSDCNWVIEPDKAYTTAIPGFEFPISGIFDDNSGKFVHILADKDMGNYRVARLWTSRCQGINFSSHVCIKYFDSKNNNIEFHAVNCNHHTGMAILPMKDK